MRPCPSSRWTLAGRSLASARLLPLRSLRIRTGPEFMALPTLRRSRVFIDHHRHPRLRAGPE